MNSIKKNMNKRTVVKFGLIILAAILLMAIGRSCASPVATVTYSSDPKHTEVEVEVTRIIDRPVEVIKEVEVEVIKEVEVEVTKIVEVEVIKEVEVIVEVEVPVEITPVPEPTENPTSAYLDMGVNATTVAGENMELIGNWWTRAGEDTQLLYTDEMKTEVEAAWINIMNMCRDEVFSFPGAIPTGLDAHYNELKLWCEDLVGAGTTTLVIFNDLDNASMWFDTLLDYMATSGEHIKEAGRLLEIYAETLT